MDCMRKLGILNEFVNTTKILLKDVKAKVNVNGKPCEEFDIERGNSVHYGPCIQIAHVRQSGGPCETELSAGSILLKPRLWALSDGPHEAELISTLVKAQRLRALLESWFDQTKAKCTLDSSKTKVC